MRIRIVFGDHGELVGALPELAYELRLARLRSSGIALWDVCKAAERAGSSDAKIQMARLRQMIPIVSRPSSADRLICFNGQPAEKLFRAKALPLLHGTRPFHSACWTPPAANARFTREEKLLRWRDCLEPFIGACAP